MSDEKFEVRVSENLLLRKPLRDKHIGGGVLHLAGLPLPNNALLQFSDHKSSLFQLMKDPVALAYN